MGRGQALPITVKTKTHLLKNNIPIKYKQLLNKMHSNHELLSVHDNTNATSAVHMSTGTSKVSVCAYICMLAALDLRLVLDVACCYRYAVMCWSVCLLDTLISITKNG